MSPQRRRIRTAADDLHGPDLPVLEYTPPDLGLSVEKMYQLDIYIQQIRRRWKPMTSDPSGLVKDLWELVEWALDGERPSHTLTHD